MIQIKMDKYNDADEDNKDKTVNQTNFSNRTEHCYKHVCPVACNSAQYMRYTKL